MKGMFVVLDIILQIVFIIINIFFGVLGAVLLYIFYRRKNPEVLFIGLAYVFAVGFSYYLSAWWPLIVGLLAAHLFKKVG